MYFSASRNFWMQAPIVAIPVAPGSSRKVEPKTDRGIFEGIRGIFGGSCYSEPGDIYIPSACVLIFYVLFREPQLLDASSDKGDSGGAGKLSKS